MNSLFFVTMLFGAVYAVGVDKDAPIESQKMEVGLNGAFRNAWFGNHIFVEEVGSSKDVGAKNPAQVIEGVVEYTAPDGSHIKTVYVGDEKGYRAVGDHLPVAPKPQPLPVYIVRALEWAKAHPYDEEAELKKTYN